MLQIKKLKSREENPHFRSHAEWQTQDSNPHAPNAKAHVPRSRQQTKGNWSQLSSRLHSAMTKHPQAQATSARCGAVSGNQADKGPAARSSHALSPVRERGQGLTRASTRHRQGIQTADRQHQAVTTRRVLCTGSLFCRGSRASGSIREALQDTAHRQVNASRQSGAANRGLSLGSENPVPSLHSHGGPHHVPFRTSSVIW